jgi:uncharacterized membrane protein YhaH (DUF805 family)
MNFSEAIQSGFSNYFNFSSRAQRSAFWYWILFTVVGAQIASVVDWATFGMELGKISPISGIFNLLTCIPCVSVGVRRLHDIGRSGWWLLLVFLVLIGWIVLVYWWCQQGEAGTNRYGPNPLGGGLQPIRP